MSDAPSAAQTPPPAAKRHRPHDRWVKLGFLVVAVGIAGFLYFRGRKLPAPRDWLDAKDLTAALQVAKDQDRHVVVLFVRHPMSQLAEDVIKKVINKQENQTAVKDGHFVAVMVRGPSAELREQYRLSEFPTLMILDPSGREIKRREGLDARPEVPFRSEFLKLDSPR